jgi:superfamily II DNA or RNA helicase
VQVDPGERTRVSLEGDASLALERLARAGAPDAGIDLVAETADGLWAVQAKHYGAAYAVRKADIDSFLSESSRPEFSYRLLITSTDHVGPTARRTMAAQEKPIGMLMRSQLLGLEVEWPTSLDRPRSGKPTRKKPRPHQQRAIRHCAKGLSTHDRGQLVMACGTGKTLVGAFLANKLAARRVLVLVPSLSLLAQTLREWATAVEFDYLAVCSDETVARPDQDAVVASTSELGVPVTTNPERIGRFLRRRGGAMKVVLATYQSSPQLASAQGARTPTFDLVIADEAHRCTGPQAGVFATVLDAEKIKARKRLFMTATPRYFTGRVNRLAQEAEWEVASMDDEKRFGQVLHRLAFAQAIDEDLLSDYQVVVVGVTDRSYRQMAERGAFVTTNGERITDARTLARQIGLLRAIRNHDLHRIVSFHSRIGNARGFAASILQVANWLPVDLAPLGRLWAAHVSGEMSSGERDARLNRLRAVANGERGLLTNARCLAEGVDVPTLDGIAFVDPRHSQVDVVQAVGRAIRKAEDKSFGTIVIPVFVGDETDAEQALEGSDFDRVWQVIRALRDQDDVLAQELDELRRDLGRRGTLGQRPGKIVLDLPTTIDPSFARAFDARLVETSTRSWEGRFGALERFVEREGHAHVPNSQVEGEVNLGWWVNQQRANYAKQTLSADRASRLNALPGWTWRASETKWRRSIVALEAFVEREGHARVPRKHLETGAKGRGYPLGKWVSVQRDRYRDGRLDPARVVELESFPGWTWEPIDTQWEVGLSFLKSFVKREGHALVPYPHIEPPGDPTGLRLGAWVTHCRSLHRQGKLDSRRAAQLESLPGWEWEPRDARGIGRSARFVLSGSARATCSCRGDTSSRLVTPMVTRSGVGSTPDAADTVGAH